MCSDRGCCAARHCASHRSSFGLHGGFRCRCHAHASRKRHVTDAACVSRLRSRKAWLKMRWSSLPVESFSRGMTAGAGRIITAVTACYVATVQWSRAILHLEPRETQMIKTIVIGAGVMGASVAYRLAQAGAAVTVLEAARIGGGTSGISFAWTNA